MPPPATMSPPAPTGSKGKQNKQPPVAEKSVMEGMPMARAPGMQVPGAPAPASVTAPTFGSGNRAAYGGWAANMAGGAAPGAPPRPGPGAPPRGRPPVPPATGSTMESMPMAGGFVPPTSSPDASGGVPHPMTNQIAMKQPGWAQQMVGSAYGAAAVPPTPPAAQAPGGELVDRRQNAPAGQAPAAQAPTGMQSTLKPSGAEAQTTSAAPPTGYEYEKHNAGPEEGFFENSQWGELLGDNGLISTIPSGDDLEQFIGDGVPREAHNTADRWREIDKYLNKYYESVAAGANNDAETAQKKIVGLAKLLKTSGWNIDVDAIFENRQAELSGEAGGGPGPAPGETVGGGELTGDHGVTLAPIADPNAPKDDFIQWAMSNPNHAEMAKVWMDYLGAQQARSDRQLSLDESTRALEELMGGDVATALKGQIAGATDPTLSPEMVENMKTGYREQAGAGLSSTDEYFRNMAASMGVPTTDLASMIASSRSDVARNLGASERDVDIYAAEKAASDRDAGINRLSAINQSLYAPYLNMIQSRMGLIAGAPGLTSGGNPFAGMTDYLASQEGPSRLDRMAAYANIGGAAASGLGSVAGAGAAVGI